MGRNPIEDRRERALWSAGVFVFLGILVMFFLPPAWTQHPALHSRAGTGGMATPDMPGMQQSGAAVETQELQRKFTSDKRESELNHHIAGVLVILAGLLFLSQDQLACRWPALRLAWPMCFLAGGLFLLLFSDTEIWPFGYMSFSYAITHNPEDAQHKAFALILLVVGVVETRRANGRLKAAWSAWVFPVAGICGSILLLFHEHGGMHGPNAMETMEKVQRQHLNFAAAGLCTALSKGISETTFGWSGFFRKVWPVFLVVLGIMLVLYQE